ncbi:MAG: hypothetical protein BRD30_00640 [Bacteroidetes bacterium QH_2_63_10]|nr:MAG: hypothetical protein BRD30_00640 [Bacteroidetes bacterium QH_2_63_10]
MPPRIASALSCACLVVLLIGCGGGTDLDVAKGRYRLVVEGGLADTLTGPAIVQSHRNGRVGIELGTRDGPGLSLEVSLPDRSADVPGLSARRYDVVAMSLLDGPSADSLSGLMAFLSVANHEFIATQGHLSVSEVGNGTVGGTLEFKMAEQGGDTPAERFVQVTGVLRVTRP